MFLLSLALYVYSTFGDECSQGGDIEMTQKVLKNVLRKLPETCLAVYKKIRFVFRKSDFIFLFRGSNWVGNGSNPNFRATVSKSEISKWSLFEGLLWRVISPSTQIIGWPLTYPWKALWVSYLMHFVSPHSEFGRRSYAHFRKICPAGKAISSNHFYCSPASFFF